MIAARVSSYDQPGGWIPTQIAANDSAANPYNLVLDMKYQAAGISVPARSFNLVGASLPANYSIPLDPLNITVSRGGVDANGNGIPNAYLVITVADAVNPSLTGVYFSGLANTIQSLTIRTAGNATTVQILGNLGIGPINIDGGTGATTIIIGAGGGGNLLDVTNAIVVNGTYGVANQVIVNDRAGNGRNYVVTGTSLYWGVSGLYITFAHITGFTLNASNGGNNTEAIQSTRATNTTINGGAMNDIFTVGSWQRQAAHLRALLGL